MPRAKTQQTLALIDACKAILEEIQPATVRAANLAKVIVTPARSSID